MSKESGSSSSGIGLASAVFLIFLVLKLTEYGPVGKWSWWWVTSPLWIGALLVIAIILIMLLWHIFFSKF
jgi:hypothetical protein